MSRSPPKVIYWSDDCQFAWGTAHFTFANVKKLPAMYLVDWLQANLLMVFTALVIIGIPVVIGVVIFSNMSKKRDNGGTPSEAE